MTTDAVKRDGNRIFRQHRHASSPVCYWVGALVAFVAVLFSATSWSDAGNTGFHQRFINDVGTSMQSTECDKSGFRLSGESMTTTGDCFVLKTKERASEVGAVSYTIRAFGVQDTSGNRYAIFTLRLNTSARMSLTDSSPYDLMPVFAPRERKGWTNWSDVTTLKVGFLKRAQQQFAASADGTRCTAVSGRRSQSVVYLAATCGAGAATSESMEQVVRATL